MPGIAGLQVIKSILNIAQLLLAEFKHPHEHHLQPYRNTQHKIYNMQTYWTPVNPPIYQPQQPPKLEEGLRHGTGVRTPKSFGAWKIPRLTCTKAHHQHLFSVKWSGGKFELPFESWRSRCFLGDEGKWKESVRIYGFLTSNLLLSTNHRKHTIFAFWFWCRYLLAGDSYVLFTPLSRGRPWVLTDPPTAHLIQIPSQKCKDKSVHQQHQQHLSHGRIVNGLVDVGPSHSWNRKQKTHQIWRCGRHQSFHWRHWFPKDDMRDSTIWHRWYRDLQRPSHLLPWNPPSSQKTCIYSPIPTCFQPTKITLSTSFFSPKPTTRTVDDTHQAIWKAMTGLLLQHSRTLQWVLHLWCRQLNKNPWNYPKKSIGVCRIMIHQKKRLAFNQGWVGFCRTGGQTKYEYGRLADMLLPGTSTCKMKYTSSKSIVYTIKFSEFRSFCHHFP